MSLSLTLLAMYKTMYMSLMVLYGGEGDLLLAQKKKCETNCVPNK
jgi:hypothetical protein